MNNQNYNFKLPESLVASQPNGQRDTARLFIYSTKTDEVLTDVFVNLERYLPADSLMVFNDTKVVPSSIELTRIIGGKIRVTFLFNKWKREQTIRGITDSVMNTGDMLFFIHEKLVQVESKVDNEYIFKILIPIDEFLRIIDKNGHILLSPNTNATMSEDMVRSRYQAIFATKNSSLVSPTASLHFTENILKSLEVRGVDKTFVTLHVGHTIPLSPNESIKNKKILHSEPISLSKESSDKIKNAKTNGKHIVAIGSTAVRLLESTADNILKGEGYEGETSLIIEDPFNFKITDVLITNFHLPNTSPLLLIDAFLKNKKSKRNLADLYELAIKDKFLFHSFGDAMLIV